MYFPEGNQAVIDELRARLRPETPLIVVDAHINTPIFADVLADCMARLLKGESPASIAASYQPEGLLRKDGSQ